MFKNIANMGNLMKQAQNMQSQMAQFQDTLDNILFEGSAGGGAVRVTLNGKGIVQTVNISPAALEDAEMLEDLVRAAFNDAQTKISQYTEENMQKITGGLQLPAGLKLPF
jgi:DNA-binding YbaB/EbfC family protein